MLLLFCPLVAPTTLAAAQEQDLIGWDNFLLGQVSWLWLDIQEQHLWSFHSCQSIKAWETSLVKQLLSISHVMWTCQNGILHHHMESAAQLLEAKTLHHTQIHEQLALGQQDLLLSDQAFVTCHSLDQVLCYAIPAQQWLVAMEFACSHEPWQCTSEL